MTDTTTTQVDELRNEQAKIGALQNEDQRPEPQDDATDQQGQQDKAQDGPQDAPADTRAARMEQLAERRRAATSEELAATQESMTPADEQRQDGPQAQVQQPAPAPERMIKIKVRGEIREMPESEVIAMAQKNEAADTYLSEARTLLEEAKRATRQEPHQVQQPAPQPQVERVDRIAKAIEQIQIGGDPAEARALLDEEINIRARSAARSVLDEDRVLNTVAQFDSEVDSAYDEVARENPDLIKDPIAANVVVSLSGGMEAELIAQLLDKAPAATQTAFAQAGITADSVRRYSPQDAHALFKDMHVKGYQLPRPAAVIKAASATVAERFKTTTRSAAPAPAPQPALDRSARKSTIQQPERASIPRTPQGQFAPRNEPQRANSAREEMRANRRTGAPR